jgi:hypothetical protein
MRVGYWIVAAITAFCAVAFIRTSLRQWRGKGRPLSYWMRGGVFDAQALAAYDRGGLVLGLTCVCFTILLGGAAIAGPPQKNAPAAEISVYVVAIAGILVTVALFLSIYHFNRPKFLVPPALRDQPGSREGRRRERAASQAGPAGNRPERTAPRRR